MWNTFAVPGGLADSPDAFVGKRFLEGSQEAERMAGEVPLSDEERVKHLCEGDQVPGFPGGPVLADETNSERFVRLLHATLPSGIIRHEQQNVWWEQKSGEPWRPNTPT